MDVVSSLFKKKKRPDEVVNLLKSDLEELAATTDEKASEKVSFPIYYQYYIPLVTIQSL